MFRNSLSHLNVQRVHSDEQRACEYCLKAGDRTNRKLTCKGCRGATYCNRECQKAHWKIHKPTCVAAHAARAAFPETEQKLSTALESWAIRNLPLLNLAGDQALLPSLEDKPGEGLLLNTHFLHINMKATLLASERYEFDVDSVNVLPSAIWESCGQPDPFEQTRKQNETFMSRKGVAPGEVFVGCMYFMIQCDNVMYLESLRIFQESVDIMRSQRRDAEWKAKLKKHTIRGRGKFYSIVLDGKPVLVPQRL